MFLLKRMNKFLPSTEFGRWNFTQISGLVAQPKKIIKVDFVVFNGLRKYYLIKNVAMIMTDGVNRAYILAIVNGASWTKTVACTIPFTGSALVDLEIEIDHQHWRWIIIKNQSCNKILDFCLIHPKVALNLRFAVTMKQILILFWNNFETMKYEKEYT